MDKYYLITMVADGIPSAFRFEKYLSKNAIFDYLSFRNSKFQISNFKTSNFVPSKTVFILIHENSTPDSFRG